MIRLLRTVQSQPAGPQTSRWAGLMVVAATATAIAPVTVSRSWTWHLSAAILLIALVAGAATVVGPAPLRAVVFVGVTFAVFAVGTHLQWPPAIITVFVCLLPLGALLATSRGGRLSPGAPWLQIGLRPTPRLLILAIGTVVAAGAALTVWTLTATPPAPPYLAQLHRYPLWLAILGIVGFAVINPIWEEALFRGVVLEDLTLLWGPRLAVVTQAVLFGAAHWAGFPNGWVGMLMAAAWGLALGILRLRTHGIVIPYLVHVAANAVIGCLALVLL